MSDIQRNDRQLVHGDPKLKEMWLTVQINERLNQLKQLDVLIDKIMTVELKQLELKKEELKKDINNLQNELDRQSIIEVIPIKEKE